MMRTAPATLVVGCRALAMLVEYRVIKGMAAGNYNEELPRHLEKKMRRLKIRDNREAKIENYV